MKKKLLVLTLSLLAIAFLAHSEEAKKGLKVFIKTRTLSDVILNGNWICCSIQSVVTLFGLSMGSPRGPASDEPSQHSEGSGDAEEGSVEVVPGDAIMVEQASEIISLSARSIMAVKM